MEGLQQNEQWRRAAGQDEHGPYSGCRRSDRDTRMAAAGGPADRAQERAHCTDTVRALGAVVDDLVERLRRDSRDPEFRRCESAAAQLLFRELRRELPRARIESRVVVGDALVDFLIDLRVAIDCDESPPHRNDGPAHHVRRRHDKLRRRGIVMLQFSGADILGDAGLCVQMIRQRVEGLPRSAAPPEQAAMLGAMIVHGGR